jgi:hypothetical protein
MAFNSSYWEPSSSYWGKASDSALGSTASKGMFDPLSLGLGLGSSIISGIFGGAAADRQAQAEIAAAREQAQATRDAAFTNLLAGQWAQTGAKDFARFAQQKAANYQQAFLDPARRALGQDEAFTSFATQSSPQAKALRREQNINQLNQGLMARKAVTDAMFGMVPTDPFSYGQAPRYTLS